jgi:hypothetical protein
MFYALFDSAFARTLRQSPTAAEFAQVFIDEIDSLGGVMIKKILANGETLLTSSNSIDATEMLGQIDSTWKSLGYHTVNPEYPYGGLLSLHDRITALESAGLLPVGFEAEWDSLRFVIGLPDQSQPGYYTTNLFSKIAAITTGTCGGTGTESCTLYVASSGPVFNAKVEVKDLGQTSLLVGPIYTGMNGRTIANLDPGTFAVIISAYGFVGIVDTITVTQDSTFTFNLTAVVYPLCAVTVDTKTLMGSAVPGAKLTITPITMGKNWHLTDADSTFMIPGSMIAYTDATGKATLNVMRSAHVVSGSNILKYDIALTKNNYFDSHWDNQIVPDTTGWSLK